MAATGRETGAARVAAHKARPAGTQDWVSWQKSQGRPGDYSRASWSSYANYINNPPKPKPPPSPPRSGSSGGGGGGPRLISAPQPAGPAPQPRQPQTRKVRPKETVQGQLKKLLNDDNPLFQQAQARGARAAASRGLINSTLAVEAGEAALIGQAVPIASQDASTFFSQAIANQAAINDFRLTETQAAFGERAIAIEGGIRQRLATISGEFQLSATRLAGQFGLAEQNASIAANVAQAYREAIARIYGTPGLTPEQQANAVAITNDLFGNPSYAVSYATLPGARGGA